MAGLIDEMKKQGYNLQQADIIDRLDDLFTEAIEAGLLTGDQAQAFGVEFANTTKANLGL